MEALTDLLNGKPRVAFPWTRDQEETERRLLQYIGPSTLEHLCVGLLQREHPDQIWTHVGGSGDGGVDGLGHDEAGDVKGILQCKFEYWGGDLPLLHTKADAQRIIAALIHNEDVQLPEGVIFLSRQEIAKLLLRHAEKLQWATMMRIRGD